MTRKLSHWKRLPGLAKVTFLAALVSTSIVATPVFAYREILVREGESLSLIAQRELGVMERWTEIAELNGIADPRRLQAGQRLLIPDAGADGSGASMAASPALPATAHLLGQPSFRRVTGAVRYRAVGSSTWADLSGATRFEPGLGAMTANTGRADFVAGDLSGELGPFTVMTLTEVGSTPRLARFRLDLGDLTVRAPLTLVIVEARAARVRIEAGEARVQSDATGLLRVTALGGTVEIQGPEGQRVPVPAGSQATVRPGAAAEVASRQELVRLLAPTDGALLAARDVQFEWSPVEGARGYQLQLTPAAEGRPELRQDVAGTTLEVRGIPEGAYSWRVSPRGGTQVLPSATSRFTVGVERPRLELSPPVLEGGAWKLRGMTSPGALVKVGSLALTADDVGDFLVDLGSIEGVTIVGIEARVREGGVPARAGIAIAGRVPGRQVPVRALLPVGQATLDGRPAEAAVELTDGWNRITWSWDVEGMRAAGGTLALALDLTPPEILAIRSVPEVVGVDQEVTIFVRARDAGTGLGPASTAAMSVRGPDSAILQLSAQDLTAAGEYRFVFRTPAKLSSGLYRVDRLEVLDRDGNAIILETRGAVIEARGPGVTAAPAGQVTQRQLFKDIFLIGIGALLGSL